MQQLQLLTLEFPLLNVNSGLGQDMKKRYYIVAKCFDRKGKLISVGINDYTKTHPLQKYFAEKVGHNGRECLHAEILAILRARGKQIYRITVERYDKHGLPVNAQPCPICQEAIKAFSISKVEYTT